MMIFDIQDPQAFLRQLTANVATPVSVVTTFDMQRPHGTTVSAFLSLSMAPAMVLVSLAAGSDCLKMIRRTGRFGLNILAATQANLAKQFAKKMDNRFSDVVWTMDHGVPRLDGALGWVACTTTNIVSAGDHEIVFGLVVGGEKLGARPLTYHSRVFGTHVNLAADLSSVTAPA